MPHDISILPGRDRKLKQRPDLSVRDLRTSKLWRDVSNFYSTIEEPAFDKISHAEDLVCSPDGRTIALTGSFWPKPDNTDMELAGTALTRICLLDLGTKKLQIITRGPSYDRRARWSPDGTQILFLSDRKDNGIFQPYVLNRQGFGEAAQLIGVDGATVEYADWSPDGKKILLGTVESGVVGSDSAEDIQWMPMVQSNSKEDQRRKLWLYELESQRLVRIGNDSCNPWEACWGGNQRIVSVSSCSPGEESWYCSDINIIDIEKAPEQEVCIHKCDDMVPIRQSGILISSPDGKTIAFVRCLSSDRGIVAGDIYVLRFLDDDLDKGCHSINSIPIGSVDVTDLKFWDDNTLMYIGISGIGIAAGKLYFDWDDETHQCYTHEQLFESPEGVAEWFYPKLSPLRAVSDPLFAIVLQSRTRPPTIGIVSKGEFHELLSFSHAGCDWFRSKVGESKKISWRSVDGLEIQGLLDLPNGAATKPYPLILHVHGGPTASWQNCWAGWPGWTLIQHLVSRGYAVLSSNPRGSTGRGQYFAEKVLGDMGGLETHDHLSGITYLVSQGIADPSRIGVMGASHGGFMANWLISQDIRFKACVSMAATNDWRSQHFTSNIRNFDSLFVQDDPYHVKNDSHYFTRSPISMARHIKTPVLQLHGALDATCDSSQAKELHNALCENSVESVLAIYPGEGHGIKVFPAVIDYTVRTVAWFTRFMPSDVVDSSE